MGFTRTVSAHCLSDRGLILHMTVTRLGCVCQAKLLRLFQLSGPKPWKDLPPDLELTQDTHRGGWLRQV